MLTENKYIIWTPPVVCLVILAIVYFCKLNVSLFYAINSSSKHIGMLWAHITILGDGLLAAILMLPFLRKHHKIVWAMLWTALIFNLILHGLKEGLNVPRPPKLLPHDTFFIIGPALKQHAFPSGHTATAAAVAGVIAFGLKNRGLQLSLFAAATMVGLSRIGVGVHWPTDVLAGLSIGWISAWLGWIISNEIKIGSGFIFQLIIGVLLIAMAAVWLVNYNTRYPQTDWLKYGLGILFLVWGMWNYFQIIQNRTSVQTKDTPANT